jgi:polysaccharide export outer membrane protein
VRLSKNTLARGIVLSLMTLLIAGCALPRSGPYKSEIVAGTVEETGNAFFVGVDQRVIDLASGDIPLGFSSDFLNAGLIGSDNIAPGDVLTLMIFENVRDDPLLGNPGQRVSNLEQVIVDGQGYIFIPYAGRIKAAGQTPEGLRLAITRKLESQTPDPQVTVTRTAGNGSTVTVAGSVAKQGVFPIERPTRALGAMLATAGGVTIEPSSAIVRVTRAGKTGKVWLQDLYDDPGLDIALRGGDQIVVERDRRTFAALGATGSQSVVPFETQTLSAIDALAQVGGLSSLLADPTGIFVFRDEPEHIAQAVLDRPDLRGDQRIVYVLDLTKPVGIFEARDFTIRDGDTVYVTEAPSVQWQKTINSIRGTTDSANLLAASLGG